MTLKVSLSVALCFCALLHVSSLRASDEILQVGKEEIVIPVPVGYVKADGEKQVSDLTKRFTAGPKSNTHLLTLLTPAAVQAAHVGKWNGLISFYVQTNPATLGDIHFGAPEFEMVKKEIRDLSAADMKNAVDKATQHMKGEDVKDLFSKISAEVGKPIQLEEGERFFTFAIPFEAHLKVISSTVLCKGKILFLYTAENPADSTADINHMRDWVKAIIAANPMESPAHAEAKKMRTLVVLIVVGLGALAGLATLIYIWRRNAREYDDLYGPRKLS